MLVRQAAPLKLELFALINTSFTKLTNALTGNNPHQGGYPLNFSMLCTPKCMEALLAVVTGGK